MSQEEMDEAIREEIRGYLELTDEELAGYGLVRSVLEYQLANL